MASSYLGNQPSNNFVSLKRQIITGNGGASYTLDHSVASVNDVAIFVNNVRQDPASYSISNGNQLTLGGTISSSDSCYVIFLGQALQTVVPDTNTITNAMIQDGTIAESKLASGVNTITMTDQFRLTANLTSSADPISANLERVDDATFAKIGTGMSLSSGVYTFPTTGLYKVEATASLTWTNDPDSIQVETYASSDSGSNFDMIARIACHYNVSDVLQLTFSSSAFVNVTNASTFRVKFVLGSLDSSNKLNGSTSTNITYFTFIRLGDSV